MNTEETKRDPIEFNLQEFMSKIMPKTFDLSDEVQAGGHLNVARGVVGAYFTGAIVIDTRQPAAPKHEWQSGGQRSAGGIGKFKKQLEANTWGGNYTGNERLAWRSVGYDDKGKAHGFTRNVGSNRIKAAAKALSKIHGIGYTLSKAILIEKIAADQAVQDV